MASFTTINSISTIRSFAGVHTALVTPFCQGDLDKISLVNLIEQQIAAGVEGIVPVGTTGESPTLTPEEHLEVIKITVQTVAKRSLVIAGTGSNCTQKTIATTQGAQKLGVDAALVVAPYYNKPSAEGMYAHFRAVAEAVTIPIILYNVPGRCGAEIPLSIVARLASDCPNIVAIKEASGSSDRVLELKKLLPPSFEILSGDDGLTLPFMKIGAVGVISVASNIIPSKMKQLISFYEQGKITEAESLHQTLAPLFRDLFIESNPVPIKTALASRDLISTEEVRLPLVSLTASHRKTLLETLASLSL